MADRMMFRVEGVNVYSTDVSSFGEITRDIVYGGGMLEGAFIGVSTEGGFEIPIFADLTHAEVQQILAAVQPAIERYRQQLTRKMIEQAKGEDDEHQQTGR
jgi:hypothetical protein